MHACTHSNTYTNLHTSDCWILRSSRTQSFSFSLFFFSTFLSLSMMYSTHSSSRHHNDFYKHTGQMHHQRKNLLSHSNSWNLVQTHPFWQTQENTKGWGVSMHTNALAEKEPETLAILHSLRHCDRTLWFSHGAHSKCSNSFIVISSSIYKRLNKSEYVLMQMFTTYISHWLFDKYFVKCSKRCDFGNQVPNSP